MYKEIEATSEQDAGHAVNRIRKQQHSALTKSFVEVMSNYNDVQLAFKTKYRARVRRQVMIVKPEATDAEVDAVLDSENGNMVFAQQTLSQDHIDAKQALEDIQVFALLY